jgi:hypothetical protein
VSEYQFYEFRSIDRPLTTKEQQVIGGWSSRTYPTSTGATFTYSYSDFPQNPKQVVAKYFDAMFYIANWGSKQLMLRFPKEVLCSSSERSSQNHWRDISKSRQTHTTTQRG